MIIEQHYDDEVLIAFLHDEPSARRDPHLISCGPCSETLQSLRHLGDALQAGEVWETMELSETPRQSTIDTLRAKQAEMAREDAAAALRVKQLLAQPRKTWATTIEAHPEWRTAGMVRRLVGEAESIVTVTPPGALEMTSLAVEISRGIDQPNAAIAAFRAHGYVLYFTGQYAAALQATDDAQRIASSFQANEIDIARVHLVRALVLADLGRDDEAIALAGDAARVFRAAGDALRFVSAVRTQGIALYHLRRHHEAIRLYASVFTLASTLDRAAFAGLAQNMALCYREMGDFAKATEFFLVALDTFQRLGVPVGIAKTKWHLGRTFLAQGKSSEALSLLSAVRGEFEELTMVQDVALVAIDIAHALLVLGRHHEVPNLCQTASEYFASAGLSHAEGALTAMALIREAVSAGRLSEAVIIHARSRVEHAPKYLMARAQE
jgi:tetratricopeptide (TPR) repeat protein